MALFGLLACPGPQACAQGSPHRQPSCAPCAFPGAPVWPASLPGPHRRPSPCPDPRAAGTPPLRVFVLGRPLLCDDAEATGRQPNSGCQGVRNARSRPSLPPLIPLFLHLFLAG